MFRDDPINPRSEATLILLKVIAIVKLVVVEAVGKWKSLLRFPRAVCARLFHSFWLADSFTFPLSLLSVYVSNPLASRCDGRCGRMLCRTFCRAFLAWRHGD